MTYIGSLLGAGLVGGMVAVASNPSPYFAALGLVVVAGLGCGMLVVHGGPFLSLVLFLIYLGGMLVVFAYSAALAAEPHPQSLGSGPVLVNMGVYTGGVTIVYWFLSSKWCGYSWVPGDELEDFNVLRGDIGGVSMIYGSGGLMLVVAAWVLLLSLLAVLELTRGLSRGALRAV